MPDDDLVAWAEAQAALLRARQFDDVDALGVASEIAMLATIERSRLHAATRNALEALLKLRTMQDNPLSVTWLRALTSAREELDEVLSASPSMVEALPDAIKTALPPVRRLVLGITKRPSAEESLVQPVSVADLLGR